MEIDQQRRFFKHPVGVDDTYELPSANLAELTTSSELVSDGDEDAFYFRNLEKQGIQLNRAQIEAVRSVDGPLLILAGAGTGKTSVLVCRTGYLLNVCHIPPKHILLMTFTKKAADEMKERIASLPGVLPGEAQQVEVRTFHSFFLQILRHSGYRQSLLTNDRFKQVILKKKMKELSLHDTYQPESILSLISFCKMNVKSIDEMPAKTKAEKEIKQLCTFYEQWKQDNQQMDFDDVLIEAYHLLKRDRRLLHVLQGRFQYVMVDEFQDTNPLQYELIKMIAHPHDHLCVVGDDDQTIYAFQGARHEIILGFEKQFKEAQSIVLSVNYRSTSPIVGLGNAVIQHNEVRKPKVLQATRTSTSVPLYFRPRSTDEEAAWIVEEIQAKVRAGTHTYKDFAILHRTTNNSRAIFEQLAVEEIPFYDNGMNGSFYEQHTIRPIIAYFQLAKNPLDWYAFETILPSMYISKEYGMQYAHGEHIRTPRECLIDHLLTLPSLKPFQLRTIEQRKALLKQLPHLEPKEGIKQIRKLFYDHYLETNDRDIATTHKEFMIEQLDELEASASRFRQMEDFLTFINKMKKRREQMKQLQHVSDASVVKLMTIHKAKGLEFRTVFFIGVSEKIIPHITALEGKYEDQNVVQGTLSEQAQVIEEERRLAYVAITRAKEELYISSPAFYRGQKTDVSRFITDVFKKEGMEKRREKEKQARSTSNKSNNKQSKTTAWICTGDDCIAWQRITTKEQAMQKEKFCPLCEAPMEKGEKFV